MDYLIEISLFVGQILGSIETLNFIWSKVKIARTKTVIKATIYINHTRLYAINGVLYARVFDLLTESYCHILP